MCVLCCWSLGVILTSSEKLMDECPSVASAQMLLAMKRGKLGEGRRRLNQDVAAIFQDVYARLCFKARPMLPPRAGFCYAHGVLVSPAVSCPGWPTYQARSFVPCALSGIQTRVNLIDDKMDKVLELVVTAMVVVLDPASCSPVPKLLEQQQSSEPRPPLLIPRGLAMYLCSLANDLLPRGADAFNPTMDADGALPGLALTRSSSLAASTGGSRSRTQSAVSQVDDTHLEPQGTAASSSRRSSVASNSDMPGDGDERRATASAYEEEVSMDSRRVITAHTPSPPQPSDFIRRRSTSLGGKQKPVQTGRIRTFRKWCSG